MPHLSELGVDVDGDQVVQDAIPEVLQPLVATGHPVVAVAGVGEGLQEETLLSEVVADNVLNLRHSEFLIQNFCSLSLRVSDIFLAESMSRWVKSFNSSVRNLSC